MKKTFYLFLVIILRIMLSFVIHVVVLTKSGVRTPPSTNVGIWIASIPLRAQFSIFISGAILGYIIGQRRREIVYIEKRHRSNRLCKNR